MSARSLSKVDMVKWVITFLAPILIWLIPTSDMFTQPMKIFFMITVFGILLLAFEFFDYGLASMLIPSLYAITGIVPMATAFSGFAQNIPWLVVGALLLTEVLNETGLLKRISYWCILRCGGSFKGIVWGIFLAGLIMTVLTSGSANFLFAPFCYGICRAFDIWKTRESAIIMFSGCISTISTTPLVYKPAFMGLALGGAHTVDATISVSWLGYLWHNIPNLLFCILLVQVSFWIFKPRTDSINGKEYFEAEYNKLGKMTVKEKKSLAVTALLFAFLLTANIHGIPMEYGFVLIPWLFLVPGIRCADSMTVKKVNFSMVMFIGACLCIGSVAGALGISNLLSLIVSPMLDGVSSTICVGIVWILRFIINFALTPLAACGTLSAPLTQIALDIGIDPLVIIYTLIGGMDQLLFPYEYASYAIFFAFSMCTMKQFVKFMSVKAILHFLFIMVIMVPWWNIVGLL